jgi:hypothetical protein
MLQYIKEMPSQLYQFKIIGSVFLPQELLKTYGEVPKYYRENGKNTQYQLISKGPQISTTHTQLLLHWWTFGNQTKVSKSSISPRFKKIPKIHKPNICHTSKANPKTNLTKTLPSNY